MYEQLLQFIWQYSLYRPGGLCTTGGEPVVVVFPGRRNTDAGPDFLAAKVRIGEVLLVGNVELHVRGSDWYRHGHQHDPAYRNIILHVVYRDDAPGPEHTPVLALEERIPEYVLNRYTSLLQTHQQIPCGRELQRVPLLTREAWLQRLLADRWEEKLAEWEALLRRAAGDWRVLLYWRMAANFGFRTNALPFLLLAQSLPLNVLARHREHLEELEALLFGQAGMLEARFREEYPRRLQEVYRYLQHKYRLMPLQAHIWKFLRMRPANFPSLRLAQFAALVHRSLHLLTRILESTTAEDIHELLDVAASPYWDTHLRFDEPQSRSVKKRLGAASVENIIINTIAPMQFLYAYHHGMQARQRQAVELLESVAAEQNSIVGLWQRNGWNPANAAQSQALIQLYHRYCTPRRCLECSIGLRIIREEGAAGDHR
jgi:hypothetical protein